MENCREIIFRRIDHRACDFQRITVPAANAQNVTVVNGTGYGIKFLGFNNPGDNDWSDNEVSTSSRTATAST